MPVLVCAGDLYYQGDKGTFDVISTFSSLYACKRRGLRFRLESSPPVFFPRGYDFDTIILYIRDFAFAFQVLVFLMENSSEVDSHSLMDVLEYIF